MLFIFANFSSRSIKCQSFNPLRTIHTGFTATGKKISLIMLRLILQSFPQHGTPDSNRTKPAPMTRGRKPIVRSEWRTKHGVRPLSRRSEGRSHIWLIYGRGEIPSPRGKTRVQIKFHTYSLPALPGGIPRPSHQRGQYHRDLASWRGEQHRAEANEEAWARGWKRRRERNSRTDGKQGAARHYCYHWVHFAWHAYLHSDLSLLHPAASRSPLQAGNHVLSDSTSRPGWNSGEPPNIWTSSCLIWTARFSRMHLNQYI